MIPELEELVETGILAPTTAIAIMKVKQPYHSFISDIQKTNKCSCFLNRTCYDGIGGSDTMKYICTLEMTVNCCQHCDPESKYCTATDTQCGFREVEQEKKRTLTREYVRQPRWYEKYGK